MTAPRKEINECYEKCDSYENDYNLDSKNMVMIKQLGVDMSDTAAPRKESNECCEECDGYENDDNLESKK